MINPPRVGQHRFYTRAIEILYPGERAQCKVFCAGTRDEWTQYEVMPDTGLMAWWRRFRAHYIDKLDQPSATP